jgi:hypothetical protein
MPDPTHDFDFLFGRWTVRNARLRERLVGSTIWDEFDATHECRPMLGGIGNVDEMATDWGGGFIGMSVRLFDLERRRWTIYWAANRTGTLEPPVHGTFTDGVGTFSGADTHAGTPVLARFVWSGITATTAHWEQAFSIDDGQTWEANWRMSFVRRA